MMRLKQIYTFVGILTLLFLNSCEYEKREEVNLDDLPDPIVYEDHIATIFNKCTQCHNGGTPPNLLPEESYLELTAGGYIDIASPENSTLYDAINGGSMTQYANDLDRAYILAWIKQEAELNN